ncbi:hypothetical protein L195_g063093, partial [Trifolium pratense]
MVTGVTEQMFSSSSNFLFTEPRVILLSPPPVITSALGKFSHEPFRWALKCLMSAPSSDPGDG